MNKSVYDFLAVGIGPFNLGLACLTAPIEELNGIFLDKRSEFNWHPGMLLQNARLQTPFLSDLVTLADPTSPYSFLNYIKEQGKIYSFYIRENFFLLRNEYNQYCQWATRKLPNLRFNTEVIHVEYSKADSCYNVRVRATDTGRVNVYRAKKLVIGTGPAPWVPACCEQVMDDAIHSSAYLMNKQALQKKQSITVVGSGQSAAEIFYDLLQDIDTFNYELSWITRSPRYCPLEYTKLTLEMTSPEYVDYFYSLPAAKRDSLNQQQKNLYKAINGDLINDIYDLLYTKSLTNSVKINLLTNCELRRAQPAGDQRALRLGFMQTEQQQFFSHTTEGLVLATGYAQRVPPFLQGIAGRLRWDEKRRYHAHRNYAVDRNGNEVFVQNAEQPTHGFVTPDLGMACYRNSSLIRAITGKEYYPVEKQIAFQRFAAPTGTKADFRAEPAHQAELA